MNVTFKIGEVVNGWTVIGTNGLSQFVVKADDVTIVFNSDAGEGINYSQVVQVYKNGRTYKAQRFLQKYVSLVQVFSNILFDKYYEENAELFSEADVTPLEDADITHQWVVIKPVHMFREWKPEYITKEHQVVLATGGFGCKGSALSSGGGKVYTNDVNGLNSNIHRSDILGIAKKHVLDYMGLTVDVR